MQKTSVLTSASGRQRALRRRKREVCGSAARPGHCRRIITVPTGGGRLGRLPVRRRRRSAGCRCPPSATGRIFTKRPSCYKGDILQKCVLSRRNDILFDRLKDTTKCAYFQDPTGEISSQNSPTIKYTFLLMQKTGGCAYRPLAEKDRPDLILARGLISNDVLIHHCYCYELQPAQVGEMAEGCGPEKTAGG